MEGLRALALFHLALGLSALVEGEIFINQLFQLIQFLLPDLQESDSKRLILNPLDLGMLDINGCAGAWNDKFHDDLMAGFHCQRAFKLGSADRQINGFAFDLMGIRAKPTLELRMNPPVPTPFHALYDTPFGHETHATFMNCSSRSLARRLEDSRDSRARGHRTIGGFVKCVALRAVPAYGHRYALAIVVVPTPGGVIENSALIVSTKQQR